MEAVPSRKSTARLAVSGLVRDSDGCYGTFLSRWDSVIIYFFPHSVFFSSSLLLLLFLIIIINSTQLPSYILIKLHHSSASEEKYFSFLFVHRIPAVSLTICVSIIPPLLRSVLVCTTSTLQLEYFQSENGYRRGLHASEDSSSNLFNQDRWRPFAPDSITSHTQDEQCLDKLLSIHSRP